MFTQYVSENILLFSVYHSKAYMLNLQDKDTQLKSYRK